MTDNFVSRIRERDSKPFIFSKPRNLLHPFTDKTDLTLYSPSGNYALTGLCEEHRFPEGGRVYALIVKPSSRLITYEGGLREIFRRISDQRLIKRAEVSVQEGDFYVHLKELEEFMKESEKFMTKQSSNYKGLENCSGYEARG